MKLSISIASLLSSFSAVAASLVLADDDWSVSLVQRQLQTGREHKTSVAAKGQGLSVAPVPEGGAEFLLWAIRQTDTGLEETLIDNEMVGAYLPTGDISIETPDPYSGAIPRTRIDQGFTVTYEVGGLVQGDGPDVPLAARQVLLDHDVASNEVHTNETSGLLGGLTSVAEDVFGDLLPAQDFDQRMITNNGLRNLDFPGSNILGSNPYQDAGVETFRLFALPDGEIAELQLDEAKVQIWPMSKGDFTGIEDNGKYSTIPEFSVNLTNLYPDSTTWVQIYPGPANPGHEGTVVNESTIVVDDVLPRTTRLVFRDLKRHLTEQGLWTIEVLTRTPFGTEILDTVSFDYGGDVIRVRGSFQSLSE